MDIIIDDFKTICFLGGLIFIFLAIVGGGINIDKFSLKIPPINKWMRVISFFMGLGLVFISFFPPVLPPTPPPTPPPITDNIIYSDSEVDTTIHNIKFIQLTATCVNDPPQVNDRITIEFTLQNIDENPIKLSYTFFAARNPFGENKDFGDSNQDKTIQPQEIIKTKASIIVDNKGIWKFGPCYSLGIHEINDEEILCPSEWRRFQILVK